MKNRNRNFLIRYYLQWVYCIHSCLVVIWLGIRNFFLYNFLMVVMVNDAITIKYNLKIFSSVEMIFGVFVCTAYSYEFTSKPCRFLVGLDQESARAKIQRFVLRFFLANFWSTRPKIHAVDCH